MFNSPPQSLSPSPSSAATNLSAGNRKAARNGSQVQAAATACHAAATVVDHADAPARVLHPCHHCRSPPLSVSPPPPCVPQALLSDACQRTCRPSMQTCKTAQKHTCRCAAMLADATASGHAPFHRRLVYTTSNSRAQINMKQAV